MGNNLSVIVASENEEGLQQTVTDLLEKASGKVEVIVVLDGYYTTIQPDERVKIIHKGSKVGLVEAAKLGVAVAKERWKAKIEQGKEIEQGYDLKLCEEAYSIDHYFEIPVVNDLTNWIDYHAPRYNLKNKLTRFLRFAVRGRKSARIANLGSGAISLVGNYFEDVALEVVSSDIKAVEYAEALAAKGITPYEKVEYQDMCNLTYPDNYFDIVYCNKALDDCDDPRKALQEMLRICKFGGYIFLRHCAYESTGNRRKWNVDVEGKDCLIWNEKGEKVLLSEVYEGFTNTRDKVQNGRVVSVVQKTAKTPIEHLAQRFNLDTSVKNPIWIESTREEMATVFNELGYKVGAEIGVERGYYSESLFKAIPDLKLFLIDAWKAYRGYRDHVRQEKLDGFFAETQERLKGRNGVYIRKYSADALKDIPNGSLDFVYIDANHEFAYFAFDIVNWTKKVRIGGIVAGHDYRRTKEGINDVKDVVQAYMYAKGVEKWFVINDHGTPPSWFFIKEKEYV